MADKKSQNPTSEPKEQAALVCMMKQQYPGFLSERNSDEIRAKIY